MHVIIHSCANNFIRLFFDENDEESFATTKPVQVKGDLYPIYEIPSNRYPAEILRILLDPNIKTQKICYGIPRNVTKSATYVIDMASLDHPDDIKRVFLVCGPTVALTNRVGGN